MKLRVYLPACGVCSRRGVKGLLDAGRVRVNGVVARNPALEVNPERDAVEVYGRRVEVKPLRYILFYKPTGYLTTRSDPLRRPTIYSALPTEAQELQYVGRLDFNSSGVLLLTNDGKLIRRLTRPEFRIKRVYHAKVRGSLTKTTIGQLIQGIVDQGELLKAQDARLVERRAGGGTVEVVLTEGKYREVRRMLQGLGLRVVKLKRVEFAGIRLGALRPGQWRELTAQEVEKLRQLAFFDA